MPDAADDAVQPDLPHDGEGAEVRHLPVVAVEARTIDPSGSEIEPYRPPSVPAAVVAATGGFLAGVAAFVLIRVLRRRSDRAVRLARRGALRRRGGVEIAQSRSFLVDIHLLRK